MGSSQHRGRETARTCFGLAIRKASRAAGVVYDDALSPAGIRHTQFSLLNALVITDRPAIGELADLMAMDRTTLTRNLQPLVRGGLAAIQPGADRRRRVVTLTAKGRGLHRRAWPRWKEAQRRVERLLGAPTVGRLRHDLNRWTEKSLR